MSAVTFAKAETNPFDGHLYFVNEVLTLNLQNCIIIASQEGRCKQWRLLISEYQQ